jgi:hypothetical protein
MCSNPVNVWCSEERLLAGMSQSLAHLIFLKYIYGFGQHIADADPGPQVLSILRNGEGRAVAAAAIHEAPNRSRVGHSRHSSSKLQHAPV